MTAPRIFFIVGYPRSGTTLLQRMVGAHRSAAVAPETSFMRRYWRVRDRFAPLADDDAFARLLGDVVSTPAFELMGLDPDAYSQAAWAAPRTYPALFRLLLTEYAALRGVPVVGEKTPKHLLYLADLDRFFPDARFLHIVRDPRAAVCSLQKLDWAQGDLRHNAAVWARELGVARRAAARYGARLLTVRYETVVESPTQVLRSVCRFLEVPFDPAMLVYHQTAPTAVDVDREPWKRNALRPPDPAALDRWRVELSAADVAAVEAEAYSEMRRWGYTPETPGLTSRAAQRTAARAVRRAGSAVRHRVRRALGRTPGSTWAAEAWFDEPAGPPRPRVRVAPVVS